MNRHETNRALRPKRCCMFGCTTAHSDLDTLTNRLGELSSDEGKDITWSHVVLDPPCKARLLGTELDPVSVMVSHPQRVLEGDIQYCTSN